nr:hypothetical protein [uncultured Anaerostipes sp.]
MECIGRLKGLGIDLMSRHQKLEIEVDSDIRKEYDKLKDKEKLRIRIVQYRKKRSLDANAYYWTLLTKFADVIGLSNPEAHNVMLRGYGQSEIFGGKAVYVTIPDTEEAEKKVNNATDYHLAPTSQVRLGNDGVMYRTYRLLRGSRTYDTKEMSRLIDGLITCCKEAGIPETEIVTPNEKKNTERKVWCKFWLRNYGVHLRTTWTAVSIPAPTKWSGITFLEEQTAPGVKSMALSYRSGRTTIRTVCTLIQRTEISMRTLRRLHKDILKQISEPGKIFERSLGSHGYST